MHGLKGVELLLKYLPIAVKDGSNIEAREAIHWANVLGGYAIAEAGVTLPHGLAMAIGGSCPYIMHGEGLAIMYPEINKITWEHAIEKYAIIGRMFNPKLKDESDELAAEKACDEMVKFLKEIGMYLSLKDKGASEDIIDQIAKDNFELPDYTNHPMEVDLEMTIDLLKKSYSR